MVSSGRHAGPTVASTIVVGYSGTEGAVRALVRAADLVDPPGELLIVYVLEPAQSISSRIEDVTHKERQRQSAVLAHGRKLAGEAQADIETIAAVGDPADELLRIADERCAGLIVVGRGRAPRMELVRQSVCEKVVRQASTCVLVVP
jgi:nucleotide-binding universal stress UspA family protein